MKNPKPEHKFFDRYLDNNLDDMFVFLSKKHLELLDGTIGNIPKDILSKYNQYNGASTQLGQYYNIFTWDNQEIKKLKDALKDVILEACDYYGIDFEGQNFYINGWFNLDYKTEGSGVSPLNHPEHYHDHAGGTGAPVFHGYYCVNAEPSSTFYKINREVDFININKNNRLVISETGHPHGRDDWFEDKPRITIAYDIGTEQGIRNGIKL